MRKLTEQEREILLNAKADGYKWIARDSADSARYSNNIELYIEKPTRNKRVWGRSIADTLKRRTLGRGLFNFIKWEDEEPTLIDDLLKTKPKFNIKDYPGNYAMHCDKKWKANIFCKHLDSVGEKWSNGDNYVTDNKWNYNKEDTCYYFSEGVYGSIQYARELNYKVLNFDNFNWEKGEKMKNKINELKAEFEERISKLEKELEESEKPKSRYEKPEVGDKYFLLDHFGDIDELCWDDFKSDIAIWNQGNGFHTKEEAVAERDRREEGFKKATEEYELKRSK